MFASSGRFPSTSWGLLKSAQDRDSREHLDATNRLIASYWRPVYYFIRARGHGSHDAEDLTQEFFLRLVERRWLDRADPTRGRFRNYLLAVLVRFLSDQGPRRAPRQQAFDERLVSVSALLRDEERAFEPAGSETPERLFMKHWARALLDEVLRRVEAWSHELRRPDWYQIFCAVNFPPPGARPPSKQEVADRFRLTRHQVRYAVEEVNLEFVTALRAEVAEQVPDEDVDLELCEIQELLKP